MGSHSFSPVVSGSVSSPVSPVPDVVSVGSVPSVVSPAVDEVVGSTVSDGSVFVGLVGSVPVVSELEVTGVVPGPPLALSVPPDVDGLTVAFVVPLVPEDPSSPSVPL